MQLALLMVALLHPVTVIAFVAIAVILLHAKGIFAWLFWLAVAASGALFGTTIAFPGYGSHLANGGTLLAGPYTNVAQLKNVKFNGLKAEFDDITNLDSPSIFKEWLKTVVDGSDVTFDGVLNPSDPTSQGLLTNLSTAGSAALNYWKLTLTNGSTLTFQGYVQDFKLGVEYQKAITFSSAIKIVGNITAAW